VTSKEDAIQKISTLISPEVGGVLKGSNVAQVDFNDARKLLGK
jgi:hypothetical protein